MENREIGLTELYERIKDNHISLGIMSFIKTPTKPVTETQMPAIIMIEDVDVVLEFTSRGGCGYPARRRLEVLFELVTAQSTDIRTLYREVRRVLFTDRSTHKPSPVIADNVFIRENRTEGPIGYGLPDVFGMRLVLDLIYVDNGFI